MLKGGAIRLNNVNDLAREGFGAVHGERCDDHVQHDLGLSESPAKEVVSNDFIGNGLTDTACTPHLRYGCERFVGARHRKRQVQTNAIDGAEPEMGLALVIKQARMNSVDFM